MVLKIDPKVLEEFVTSIFRVEGFGLQGLEIVL